jgi:hypothetical protein
MIGVALSEAPRLRNHEDRHEMSNDACGDGLA